MASTQPAVLLPSGVEDVTAQVKLCRVSEYQYQAAGVGGSADIFSGLYRQKNGAIIEVAVKCIRIVTGDDKDENYEQKARKKLVRELEIWHALKDGPHIIQLFGVMQGVGPLPAPVCPLCTWNLQVYLERTNPPPKHIQMMTDTLQGLTYMHELKPRPIIHGDIKSENILVTADERAIICDFGRSRTPRDQSRELTGSSPFVATYRYMSPELFLPNIADPTPGSDMWAYGCVLLEVCSFANLLSFGEQILCRIRPYHEVLGEYAVGELIKQGKLPSDRPRGARALLINDSLWSTLILCWSEQNWRPTSRILLERLTQMLRNGEVSTSPALMDIFPLVIDGPPLPWPDEVRNYAGYITILEENGMMASSIRATVWIGILSPRRRTTERNVVIKVPRLNVPPERQEPHDHLQHMIRKTFRARYGIKHRNIVDLLGIDSTFQPHPGFVMEYCDGGSLTAYYKEHYSMNLDSTSRLPAPDANAYSLICDILEGLGYMHGYPVPIPQGDLTPDNILVSAGGVAKIGLFSIGRIIAAVPAVANLSSSLGPLLPFRWMSPEILVENRNPSAESDMWAMGCVTFWMFTGLRPYAVHLRDDFAGVENVRGLPPGDITRIDFSHQLQGERAFVAREGSWITNGIWDLTSKCWALEPLLRPSATNFLRFLKGLDGKKENWMPPNMVDLAKRVQRVNPKENWIPMALYHTTWRQYNTGRPVKIYDVKMILVKSTYTPNWYSKPVQVTIKQVFLGWSSRQWLDPRSNNPSVRHEVTIMSQINHPNICKLLGIDTSFGTVPSMVFEPFGEKSFDMYVDEIYNARQEVGFYETMSIFKGLASALAYIHGHFNGTIVHGSVFPRHIFIADGGHVQLTNFTSAVQYIANRPRILTPLSSVISTPERFSHWQSPEYYRSFPQEDADYVPLPTTFSDMWSFGCIMLHAFARYLPFFRQKVSDAVAQLQAGIGPCPEERPPTLDPRVWEIVLPLLVQEPASRPSARDVLQSILACLHPNN